MPPPFRAALPGHARPHPIEDAAPHKGRGSMWAIVHRHADEQRQPEHDGWPGTGPFPASVAASCNVKAGNTDVATDRTGGGTDAEAAGDSESWAQEVRPSPQTQVFEERAQTVLNRVDSPDIGFERSVNPYRGCEHGCIYCYARPGHSWLGWSPGLDFETRIVAKVNAAERLRAALSAPGFEPRSLNIGSVTDAYQPAERRLGITRGVIEVLAEARHPFSVITKSAGIERDLDLIAPMAAQQGAAAYVSITTLDPTLARILEPRAASPQRRLDTVRRLAQAGVPVGVSVSPLVPFINEPELERILEAARDAGARSAFAIVIRLPWEVNPLFQHWLESHFPDRAARVMARIREMRGGADNSSRFGERMRGSGVWADLLRQRLHKACGRLGLARQPPPLDYSRFRPPRPAAAPAEAGLPVQRSLFDDGC